MLPSLWLHRGPLQTTATESWKGDPTLVTPKGSDSCQSVRELKTSRNTVGRHAHQGLQARLTHLPTCYFHEAARNQTTTWK